MTTRIAYGAAELKRYSRIYWLTGLLIAIAFHLSLIGSYYAFPAYAGVGGFTLPPRGPAVFFPTPMPPPLPGIIEPRGPVAAPARDVAAMPIPVPAEKADPERTMATQDELRALVDPPDAKAGDGTGMGAGEAPLLIPETEAPPPDVVLYEKGPEIVTRVIPVYPDIALRAGIDGRVWVKIWVDKQGRARKAIVTSRENEIFHEAALDAAMQFVFTPAIMNGNPVSVWVSIPFSFRLK
jgi:periplasmic protein TonB